MASTKGMLSNRIVLEVETEVEILKLVVEIEVEEVTTEELVEMMK